MQEVATATKFLSELGQLLAMQMSEEQLSNAFTGTLASTFGLDKVAIREPGSESSQPVCEYVANTKKLFVDNQLSEYSAFTDLIAYKNAGFGSYCAVPVLVDGSVVSIVEMLSKRDGTFTGELVDSILPSVSLLAIALSYKREKARSLRLAEYFDAAFNHSTPQFLVGRDGIIVRSNRSALSRFNLSAGAGMKINTLLDIDPASISSVQRSSVMEARAIGDSEPRLFSLSINRISDALVHIAVIDSSPASLMGSILAALSGSTDLGIAFIDQSFAVRQISAGLAKLLGTTPEIASGKSLLEMIAEKQRPLISDNGGLPKAIENGTLSATVDLAAGTPPRRLHILMTRSFYGAVVFMTRADAEKSVELLSAALDDFAEASSDIIITIDGLGFIKRCNMPVLNALGYTKDELVGKDVRLLYEESNKFLLDRDIAYVKNGGKVDNTYVLLLRKAPQDGSGRVPTDYKSEQIPATHHIRALRGEEGAYAILIKEQVTKQEMRAQKEDLEVARRALQKLQSNSELKSQFIYNISHELKTPLTSIKGFAKLLYDGDAGELNPDQRDFVKTILDESDRFILMIQQILDAAKLEANKVVLDFREVNLAELRNNPSIRALEESMTRKGLSFSWSVSPDVPDVSADQNRLIQVFVNLIGNAIKFTDTGGISVRIFMENKSRVRCEVSDTGMGISDIDQKRLFKKFYQVQNQNQKTALIKPEGTGTGLGLSITKEIVLLHHGKINVRSELGKGSTFWFTLPIAQRPRRKRGQRQQNQAQPYQQQSAEHHPTVPKRSDATDAPAVPR